MTGGFPWQGPVVREYKHFHVINFSCYTQVKPGLSSFEDNWDGIDAYIKELVAKAVENVPSESQSSTPIFLLATAGEFLSIQSNI